MQISRYGNIDHLNEGVANYIIHPDLPDEDLPPTIRNSRQANRRIVEERKEPYYTCVCGEQQPTGTVHIDCPSSAVNMQRREAGVANNGQRTDEIPPEKLKTDCGKPEYDRLNWGPLGEFNAVHKMGDEKYTRDSWKQGIELTRLLNAIIRHTTAMLTGQMVDEESGYFHSSHAAVNCEMLTYYLQNPEKYATLINDHLKKSERFK